MLQVDFASLARTFSCRRHQCAAGIAVNKGQFRDCGVDVQVEKVQVAIIGSGRIADVHAESYRRVSNKASLVAIAGPRSERVQAKAQAWGVGEVYESTEAVLADPAVDAVDICLPHHLHLDTVLKACEAHKHILLEKPIARTLKEVDHILQAVDDAGIIFMLAHNHVFNPIVQKAQEIIQKGLIGRVHLAKAASFGWFYFAPDDFRRSQAHTGGGALIDTGVHFIYILQLLLGEVQSVTTVQGRLVREEMEGEDTAVVGLRFGSGAIGEITISYASRMPEWERRFPEGWDQTVTLLGTTGAVRFSLTEDTLWYYSEADMPTALKPSSGWTSVKIGNAYATSFYAEVAHFVEHVQQGTCPVVGVKEGRKALEVVEAAYRSAREGRTIYLDRRTT